MFFAHIARRHRAGTAGNLIPSFVRWCCPFLLAAAVASPALGEDRRELCPDRPGLGTPPCTVAAGEVVGELGVVSWKREDSPQSRADTIVIGDALLRFGLTDSLEGQIGWAAFSHLHERDRVNGIVAKASGTGDVTLALRQNLANPDGSGFSVAVMPYTTLPVGSRSAGAGAGDWGAGLLVPISFDLGHGVSFGLTPRLDAAVDANGTGRHVGFGSVAGIGLNLAGDLSATAEFSLYRDHDPAGHNTQAVAGLSAGWQADDSTQFDLGFNLGVNAASSDSELYFGIARRF